MKRYHKISYRIDSKVRIIQIDRYMHKINMSSEVYSINSSLYHIIRYHD